MAGNGADIQWCFSQVKGAIETEDITEADIISCVEYNNTGDLLATGDKGGRVVIFQRDKAGRYLYHVVGNIMYTALSRVMSQNLIT